MGPITLIVAAVVVVVVIGAAYLLGTFMRFRDRTPPQVIDAKPHFTQAARPEKPARPRAAPLALAPDDRQLQAVTDWLLTQAFEQTGIRVADDPLAYQRIAEAAQKAVHDLKTKEAVSISLPFLTADVNGPKHFETRLTREVINELARY
jgi:hypothetical protein